MQHKEPLILNREFQDILQILESGQNMFITGRAGTGKSTLLRLFRNSSDKKIAVLAPTGIAALNVQGQTIHSFFKFPPRFLQAGDIKKQKNSQLYKKLDTIVIDEISMVRADMMDSIDLFLRINRNSNLPFGGIQMVLIGDLFQLPPVVSTQEEKRLFSTLYDSPYFFSSKVIQNPDYYVQMFELQEVYRQEERYFIRLLDHIRLNQIDYDDLDDLNERYIPDFNSDDYYVTLSARNKTVDDINQSELLKLDDDEETFLAGVTGDFNPRLFPTDLTLNLKLGAQIMFIKNDPERRFVNGTIGKVTGLDPYSISVTIEKGGVEKEIKLEKETWEIIRYKSMQKDPSALETEIVGTFTQYPIKLAWAITIHRSQGKTFDKVIIDLGKGAFEHGQTYVALSRCRSLKGIVLRKRLRPQDIMVDNRIVEFYENQLR